MFSGMQQEEDGSYSLIGKIEDLCGVQEGLPCTLCHLPFRDQRDLKRHMKRKHSLNESDAFAIVTDTDTGATSPVKQTTGYTLAPGHTLGTVDTRQLQNAISNMAATSGEVVTGTSDAAAGGLVQCQTVHIGHGGTIVVPFEYHTVDMQLTALGYSNVTNVTNVQ